MKSFFDNSVRYTNDNGKYGNDKVNSKSISKDEMNEYILKAQKGDRKAKEFILNYNEGAIQNFVKPYKKVSFYPEDLLQEVRLGFLKAIDHFDPSKGFTLLNFANYYMKDALNNALKTSGKSLLSISYNEFKKVSKVRAVYSKAKQLFELKTENEIIEYVSDNLGMNISDVKIAINASNYTESYDVPFSNYNNEETKLSTLQDKTYKSPEYYTVFNNSINYLYDCIDELPEDEKSVLLHYYGLKNTENVSLAKIANDWGCSRAWISQIYKKAKNHLKNAHEELQDFII